jgi:hypothetical protein
MESLKFPIGKFELPTEILPEIMEACKATIQHFPDLLEAKLKQLNSAQLNDTYREGSWSIRQVVHHLADSHMNAFVRFKLALTEDKPIIKPYNQDAFVDLEDAKDFDITPSLSIIRGVHERWSKLLYSMTESDFERIYIHPEYGHEYRLKEALALYDWHCRTHLGHIKLVINTNR